MCIGNNDNPKNHDCSRLLMIVPKRVIRNVRLGTEPKISKFENNDFRNCLPIKNFEKIEYSRLFNVPSKRVFGEMDLV